MSARLQGGGLLADMAPSFGLPFRLPWDTMTSQRKVDALQSLVRREAERVMPTLLQKQ
jgi:hypothetical protein